MKIDKALEEETQAIGDDHMMTSYETPLRKDAFELRTVQIGQITQGKMQILHGASIGDLILLNVPDKYNGLKLIDMES